MRKAQVHRVTKETDITAAINLDGSGIGSFNTKIGFFDHMLEQLCCHSLFDITLHAIGDIHVDYHHLIEDAGLVTGEAFTRALGDKQGINRYGLSYVPMDEALLRVTVDISNRPHLEWHVVMTSKELGNVDTELFKEWFLAFSRKASITLHVECLYGNNNHHIIEGIYKALARALRQAVSVDNRTVVPSTKGVL